MPTRAGGSRFSRNKLSLLKASVRGIFEAIDARLEVGDSVFETAHPPIDLDVGELDHRLRFGSSSSIFSSSVVAVRSSLSVRCATDSATS